jgi:hypothetical protein
MEKNESPENQAGGMIVENWHSAMHVAHQREKRYQREAEQYRLAKLATADCKPGRSYHVSLRPVLGWLQCRLAGLRRRTSPARVLGR